MLYAVIAVWVVIMVPGFYFMMLHTLQSMFGSA
jgi:hypothetical protein